MKNNWRTHKTHAHRKRFVSRCRLRASFHYTRLDKSALIVLEVSAYQVWYKKSHRSKLERRDFLIEKLAKRCYFTHDLIKLGVDSFELLQDGIITGTTLSARRVCKARAEIFFRKSVATSVLIETSSRYIETIFAVHRLCSRRAKWHLTRLVTLRTSCLVKCKRCIA